MKRTVQSLNGLWDYRIADGEFTKKQVPYSDLSVGFAECRLEFDATSLKAKKRAFLVFDGVTYGADVILNGKALGHMLPYSEYRYEVTDILTEKNNLLSVTVVDIDEPFGPSEGWENYSGIIRDVYIEYTEESIITDVFWHSALADDLKSAVCTAEISTENRAENLFLKLALYNADGECVRNEFAKIVSDKTDIEFVYDSPQLWSPDTPYLYTLKVELASGDTAIDTYECRIGFKHFCTKGKRFYLNGEPLFLTGVCRHDTYGDSGHVMSEEQMYTDMRMIKELGVNYVRLVHYPHHKRMIEIADELGLFVSEEPGLWWSDVSNEQIFERSLEVLRRTVLRDRNHVSIAFWLSFNECIFTPEYIKASGRVCREVDPYRLVSGANCMNDEMTKKYYKECGFDFYTMHPYSSATLRLMNSATALDDMPLLLTEWGGYYVYDHPAQFEYFVRTIVELWHNPEDKPVVTGAAIWCWNEMYEFNRSAPACRDGVLREGLVDIYRRPNMCAKLYKELFAEIKNPRKPECKLTVCDAVNEEGNYTPIEISQMTDSPEQKDAFDNMMRIAEQPIPRYYHNGHKLRIMKSGPVLPEGISKIGKLPVSLSNRPIIADAERSVEIEIGKNIEKLYLVGATSMPEGFPIGGKYGEVAAVLTLKYEDGESVEKALRNGKELTTATAWFGPSRINPVASEAPRALHFIWDMDKEHYVANLLKVDADSSNKLSSVSLKVVGEAYNVLTYGVTVKE